MLAARVGGKLNLRSDFHCNSSSSVQYVQIRGKSLLKKKRYCYETFATYAAFVLFVPKNFF